MDLKRVHHHVQRLCSLGLLRVVGLRSRPGRAIKLYRAAADSFFIPFEAAPELFTDKLSSELRAAIRDDHLRSGDGMMLDTDEHGHARMRLVTDPEVPGRAFEAWSILRLTSAEAAALQQDLKAVLDRYSRQASGNGKPYLVHAAFAQRLEHTISVDNAAVRKQP